MEFTTAEELIALCGSENMTIADVMRRRESTEGELDPQTVEKKMKKALDIMRDSAHKPMSEILPSRGGMIGGEAAKLSAHAAAGKSICGSVLTKALIFAGRARSQRLDGRYRRRADSRLVRSASRRPFCARGGIRA